MEEEITPAVVTCGTSHTAIITRRGMLYTCGLGNRGELGLGMAPCGEVGARQLVWQVRLGRTSKAGRATVIVTWEDAMPASHLQLLSPQPSRRSGSLSARTS